MIFHFLGSCKESGKEYALYSINVYRASSGGTKSWTVFRRYSDFDDLHMHLKEKVGSRGCSMRRELTDVLIVSLLALVQPAEKAANACERRAQVSHFASRARLVRVADT